MVVLFSSGSSDVTSFLMTEARQYNTEIRLSVGKVADKVDQLASKVKTSSARICLLSDFKGKEIHLVFIPSLTDR